MQWSGATPTIYGGIRARTMFRLWLLPPCVSASTPHCIDDAPGPRWTTSALHVQRATLSLESSFSQAPHVCTHCGILWKIRQAIASASTSRRLCYWLLTTTPQAHHQYSLLFCMSRNMVFYMIIYMAFFSLMRGVYKFLQG